MIFSQLDSNCGIHWRGKSSANMATSMSAIMPMNILCHDTDFKNSFFYLPHGETCHMHPEDASFLHEGPQQADTYETMNSMPHLNLSSPSFTPSSLLSPAQTTSLHFRSVFSNCSQSDPRLLHYQQQQHFEPFPNQHRSCSSQEADSCNENFITKSRNHNSNCENINNKNILQPKPNFIPGIEFSSDCTHFMKDTNDNMNYDQEAFDDVFEMLKEEAVHHDISDIGRSMSDDYTDSAVSRSNSRSSVYDSAHPSYASASDHQYDSYDYQSVCISQENPYIKTENYGADIPDGGLLQDNAYHHYYQNDYGNYSPECASYPHFFPNGNCSVASYTAKQSYDLQHMSIRQGSPISDEGFDEPSIPDEALPRFLNIQPFMDSDRDSHSGRSISSSPKEKRKLDGELMPSHEKERRKPGRKPGQVSNVLHLWEFMRDLLHNADGRGIIEWVSRQEGVFRVLNSSEVARLWGEKKKNKKQMTYEKLSRSLRYSRLEGYFADLPKDKNYPKKLCFKFGSKAKNWR